MTIGKKLYVNFGIILTMVLVLFLVNWSAVQREHPFYLVDARVHSRDGASCVRDQWRDQGQLARSAFVCGRRSGWSNARDAADDRDGQSGEGRNGNVPQEGHC